MLIDLIQQDLKRDSVLAPMNFFAGFDIEVAGGNVRLAATGRLAAAMSEIVVRSVGSHFFQISQNPVRILHREVPENAAIVFPKFEVRDLDQVLHQRPGRLPPKGRDPQGREADCLSHPRYELFPCTVVTRSDAKADQLWQG